MVFIGLILLMAVDHCLWARSCASQDARRHATAAAPPTAAGSQLRRPPSSQRPRPPAPPVSVKLYDVDDKDAAMLMAIVADKMGKPLNELRFKSIKEVKVR